MNTATLADQRADRIAARATGFGAGLITFMLTWTIAARITERIFAAPTSAYVAMGLAFLTGTATTVRIGHRLVSSLNTTSSCLASERHLTGHSVAFQRRATRLEPATHHHPTVKSEEPV